MSYGIIADSNIFVTNQGVNILIIITFVDDLNIFFCRSGIISYIKSELIKTFEIIDIRSLIIYIELQVTQD